MYKLTTEELNIAIKLVNPAHPKMPKNLEGPRLSLFHILWLELDHRNCMLARFQDIMDIRKRNKRIKHEQSVPEPVPVELWHESLQVESGCEDSPAMKLIMQCLDEAMA